MNIIQFSRQSCPPCQMLKRKLNSIISIKNNIKYTYVDIDTFDLLDHEQLFVNLQHYRSLPIVAVIENEKIILEGSINTKESVDQLLNLIDSKDNSDIAEIIND